MASAGIPDVDGCRARLAQRLRDQSAPTNLEVLSKPPVQYTSEARQLQVQGDVILRVTFTATARFRSRAWCMDWAMASMKRPAASLRKFVFVPPPATDRQWT